MGGSSIAEAIRIILVDDHILFRQVLRRLLEEQPDLRVVAELSDGGQVCDVARATEADLLLLDLEMPGVSGYDVLRQLQVADLKVDTIVLTGSEDRVELAVAVDLGARGVVQKKAATHELLKAIRHVHQGLSWLDRRIRGAEREPEHGSFSRFDLSGNPSLRQRESWDELTPRESEVAALVIEGLRYKEIARRLRMSPSTLNNHLRNIFDKLQIHGRVELALYGLRRR